MAQFRPQLALVIAVLGLGGLEANPVHGAVLFIGKYAALTNQLNWKARLEDSFPIAQNQEQDLKAVLKQGNLFAKLPPGYYQAFLENSPEVVAQTEEQIKETLAQELEVSTAAEINQDIQEHYQNVIEENAEQIGLLPALQVLLSQEGGITEEATAEQLEQAVSFLQSEGLIASVAARSQPSNLPLPLTVGFLLIIGWRLLYIFAPMFSVLSKSFEEGVVENLKDKYGNPKVSESTVFLHNRAFKELERLARQAERVDNEKFGNEEFLLFVKIKRAVAKGVEEYKKLNYSGELLNVAIAAQGSFLKIEQTELRYRSRKQQEFYRFVADSIAEEPDKDKFRDKVKKKLAEVVPLLNSKEGRQALQSYLEEIHIVSQHELGLKLLALFKQYQLSDFTILRTVSDLVNRLQGRDLLAPDNLVVLVIENYDVFEKLGPIIGVSEAESSPEAYAKILQYMGLIHRHKDSFAKFEQLLKILKKWEKPYQSVAAIRKEYTSKHYRIPEEFQAEIPGLNVYKKYEKHLT